MREIERSLALPATAEGSGEGIEFRQEADWRKLSQVKPEQAVTVLLATQHAIAIGHLDIDGEINLEFMPCGQMESTDDELEFTHWMYLPDAPCWLRALRGGVK
jgi:hypothetical protein